MYRRSLQASCNLFPSTSHVVESQSSPHLRKTTKSRLVRFVQRLQTSMKMATMGKNSEPKVLIGVVFLGIVMLVLLLVGLAFGSFRMFVGQTVQEVPWKSLPRPSTEADQVPFYAALRTAFAALYPPNEKRSLQVVRNLQKYTFQPHPFVDENDRSDVGKDPLPYYDIYNCPDRPPAGYPRAWKLMDILRHWPADDPEPRMEVFQGICVFDFTKDYAKAMAYRDAEVPFVIQGDPQVAATVERWNSDHYMETLLGDEEYETEYSETNHFTFWSSSLAQYHRQQKMDDGWKEPTKKVQLSFSKWLQHANDKDKNVHRPDEPHWYFRLNACGSAKGCADLPSEFLFDELPFFQPKKSLYMKAPDTQRGIHCRFGTRGVISTNHFDGPRNMIALLKGERRYLLSHPDQCKNLALYPPEHPSARHSAVDWSDPDLEQYPEFADAKGNEVVLQAGDMLYLPTLWFHHIISLSANYQCNSRSGMGKEYMQDIHRCGF